MKDEMWTLTVALVLCAFVVGLMTGIWAVKKNTHEAPQVQTVEALR